jgi:hypothetical protein
MNLRVPLGSLSRKSVMEFAIRWDLDRSIGERHIDGIGWLIVRTCEKPLVSFQEIFGIPIPVEMSVKRPREAVALL